MDSARERGATEMLLEVITENAPAIALYEKLGFEHVRELEVLSLPEAAGGGGAEEAPLDVAQALIAARREDARAVAARGRDGRAPRSAASPHRRRSSPATLPRSTG